MRISNSMTRINNHLNSLKTEFAIGMLFMTGAVGLGVAAIGVRQKDIAEAKKECKEYVQKYNPSKYEQLNSQKVRYEVWKEVAEQVKDSLYIDSIAQTNYAKGLQAAKNKK